jgi:hypothetical protein
MCLSIMSDGKNGGDIAVELFFFFYCELPCVKLLYIHTYAPVSGGMCWACCWLADTVPDQHL